MGNKAKTILIVGINIGESGIGFYRTCDEAGINPDELLNEDKHKYIYVPDDVLGKYCYVGIKLYDADYYDDPEHLNLDWLATNAYIESAYMMLSQDKFLKHIGFEVRKEDINFTLFNHWS